MPKLRVLSGKEVVAIFVSLGFTLESRRGSHVKLRRISLGGEKQTLTIPDHTKWTRELFGRSTAKVYDMFLNPN